MSQEVGPGRIRPRSCFVVLLTADVASTFIVRRKGTRIKRSRSAHNVTHFQHFDNYALSNPWLRRCQKILVSTQGWRRTLSPAAAFMRKMAASVFIVKRIDGVSVFCTVLLHSLCNRSYTNAIFLHARLHVYEHYTCRRGLLPLVRIHRQSQVPILCSSHLFCKLGLKTVAKVFSLASTSADLRKGHI